MLKTYFNTLIFVSLLTFNLILSSLSASAIDTEPEGLEKNHQNGTEIINSYYEDPEKFIEDVDDILCTRSLDSSDGESEESQEEMEEYLDLLKTEAAIGNPKAKVLYFYAMVEDHKAKTEEWVTIRDWLTVNASK